MLFWQFSNTIIYVKIIAKIPDQLLSVLLFSNPGDKVQILVENTGRICPLVLHLFWTVSPGFENKHTFKCWPGIFPTILTYMIMLENWQNNISVYGCSLIQGTTPYSCWNLMKPGCQSGTYKELLKLATLTKNMCSQLNQDLGGDSILGKVVKVKYLWGHSV